MELKTSEERILAALEDGLPLVERPYKAIGDAIGSSEQEVIEGIRRLVDSGVIRRFGVIVRHHELGYRANAMTVWDVPDERVAAAAALIADAPFVSLCYRRPRRLPEWPYNLFCMIHGRDRDAVLTLSDQATQLGGLAQCPRSILFSQRRFKQHGARYARIRPADRARKAVV